MYLAGKLHLFDQRGHIYKSLVVLAPMILAALIATSRVSDYRHHWQDVTAGSFMGAIFAVFAYRQYYPSLASGKSNLPFSPRVTEDLLPMVGSPVGNNDHRRYRDFDDDDADGLLGIEDTVAPGSEESGTGLGFTQFFRRDETDDTLTGNSPQSRIKPNNNNSGVPQGELVSF
jgi:diacylglycerol diphosphate phosphatase/phosphatidate phosphatase